jgi:hypothetical protein
VREYLVDIYGEDGLPFNTRFGNGDAIGADVVQLINEVYEAHTARERWQGGDLPSLPSFVYNAFGAVLSLGNSDRSPLNNVNQEQHDRNHQEDMQQAAQRVAGHEAQEPQHQQQDYQEQHVDLQPRRNPFIFRSNPLEITQLSSPKDRGFARGAPLTVPSLTSG